MLNATIVLLSFAFVKYKYYKIVFDILNKIIFMNCYTNRLSNFEGNHEKIYRY